MDYKTLCMGLTLSKCAYNISIHVNRKPVEVSEDGSDVIARIKVRYEASCGVLYSLQRRDRSGSVRSARHEHSRVSIVRTRRLAEL